LKTTEKKTTERLFYDESIEKSLIWDGGACVDKTSSRYASSDQISFRQDVLRCLLSIFSSTLFHRLSAFVTSPGQAGRIPNKFLELCCCSPETPHLGSLFYSLVNTIFTYDPTGSLPYSSVLLSDPQEELTEFACHVINNLLHYKPNTGSELGNIFLAYLQTMKNPKDFAFISKGFYTLFGNIIQANNTYLFNSQKMIEWYEEVVILLWKFLDENKAFKLFLCKDQGDQLPKLLFPLLYIIQTSRQDQSKFPLVQLCSFILLSLSGIREFGVALNSPFDQRTILQDLPLFTGNLAELLIIVFHRIIVTDSHGICRPLFDCFLTILCNISPYIKYLSMVGAGKIVSLFEAFCNKKFLYGQEKNHQYVILLLELMNNMVQYQYEGSIHLVYAILRQSKVFFELNEKPDIEEVKTIYRNRQLKLKELENRRVEDSQKRQQQAHENVGEVNENNGHEEEERKKKKNFGEGKQIVPGSNGQTTTTLADTKKKDTVSGNTSEMEPLNQQQASVEVKIEVVEEKIKVHLSSIDDENKDSKMNASSTDHQEKESSSSIQNHQQPVDDENKGIINKKEVASTQMVVNNEFVPNEEWLWSWRIRLPLKPIMTLLKVLEPEIQKICDNNADSTTEEDVLLYLKRTTLVGLLPVPHTIILRNFHTNSHIDAFITTYIWGLIYLRTLNPPMFDSAQIKLFTVNVVDK